MKRNAEGLLESVQYVRNPDGTINWRAMIKPEHLYINREYEKELKTRFNKANVWDIDVTKVEDKHLLILLAGIKDLARLRGFNYVKQTVNSVTDNKAVVTCEIEFIGNFETDGRPIVFSDVASASVYSVSDVFQLHLEAIAANRAFVRCVRNALGVNITGKDEFDPRANEKYKREVLQNTPPVTEMPEATGFKAVNWLESKCQALGKAFSFEKIRESAMKIPHEFKSNPEEWKSFADISEKDSYVLLAKISENADKKNIKK